MGRRKATMLPQMRHHKGKNQARVRLTVDGRPRDVWLGPWGSDEARLRYDAVIQAYLASGRTSIQAADVVPKPKAKPGRRARSESPHAAPSGQPAVAAPITPTAAAEPAAGLTVAELCMTYKTAIKASRPETYKKTSAWHGSLAVWRALRPYAAMPAKDFGPRQLIEVRQTIAQTPIVRIRKDGTASEPKPRSRRYTNDTIKRIVAMFEWAIPRELVPDHRAAALRTVKPLRPGELECLREATPRKAVPDNVVEAVCAALPPVTAALVRFIRLTGCRPSEARLMRMCEIADRQKDVWRLVPQHHKNEWRNQSRHIAIGPKAQAIILAMQGRRSEDEYVFDPRLNVPAESANQGIIPIGRWACSRAGDHFAEGSLRRAVQRAAERAKVGHWFPYLLRYSRTQEVRDTDGPEAARAVAGHKSDAMTAHYAPPDFEHARRAAARSG